MNITDIVLGYAYKLTEESEDGVRFVQIASITGDKIVGATGVFSERDGFRTKTFFKADGKTPVRRITLTADQIAEFVEEGEKMSQNETHVELDEDQPVTGTDNEGNEIVEKKPMTAAEKIEAIKKAEKEKIDAVKKKEEARDKAAADKRVAKLSAAAEAAGLKEKEAAETYSDGRVSKFKDFTDAETKAAVEKMKVVASERKKADKAAEKNSEKLTAAAEKAGVKEADVALQFSEQRTKKFAELTAEEVTAALEDLKEKAKDKAKADALALKTNLTDEEAAELKGLEKVIEKNLGNFQNAAFQIGGALLGINQRKLYRQTHPTLEAYVSERFGLSRPHAYSVMSAAQTFAALTEGQEVDVKSLPSITAAEAITRGVKGLMKEAGLDQDAEAAAITRSMARNVFAVALQNAPKDKDGKPILSPSHLNSTFEVLGEVARSGLVEIDGKQIPVNLAAASIDEMITEESQERVLRMKANLVERITAAESASKEAKPSKLDSALNSATGNGVTIPEGVTPKLNVICSVHGRNVVEETSDVDVTLGCGCVFVSTPEGYLFDKSNV